MRDINQSGSKIIGPTAPFSPPSLPPLPPSGGFLFLVVSGLLWVSRALRLPGLVPAPFLPPPLIFGPKFSALGLSTCAHQVNEGGKRRQRSGRLAARLFIAF